MFFKKEPRFSLRTITNPDELIEFVCWFAENDKIVKSAVNPLITKEYSNGRRASLLGNTGYMKGLETDDVKIPNQLNWLAALIQLDFSNSINMSAGEEMSDEEFKNRLEDLLEKLEQKMDSTIIKAGELMEKYNLDTSGSFDKIADSIKNEEDKEVFIKNIFEDTIFSSEFRMLVWIYNHLFKTEYKVK